MDYTAKEFAKLFDHTLLKPFATRADLKTICDEAAEYGFCSVAVNTGAVGYCAELLRGSGVRVDAAVAFPLGITTIAAKVNEALGSIADGAGEVDYVLNIGRLKEMDLAYIREEMHAMTQVCREHGVISKVIFENCYLTDDEKRAACDIALEVRPDFIKTSTGFGTGGATAQDVRLMKAAVGDLIAVKAAGGIRTLDDCMKLLEAGASRIGCSASAAICTEYRKRLG